MNREVVAESGEREVGGRAARPGADAVGTGHGLYLHLPFCARICPYCDFAVVKEEPGRRRAFVDSLVAEIDLWSGWEGSFDTVYLGGGTPSTLDEEELGRILEKLRAVLSLSPDAGLFLEANPEDATRRALEVWAGLGFRHLSLGVQALEDRILRRLGRRHDADQARRSLLLAREIGFETVSMDLIYALPEAWGFGLEVWRRSLEEAAKLGPHHLSCYQLTVHQGTPFGRWKARGGLVEPSEDLQAEHFLLTHRVLEDLGYEGYEVSNFARRPEHRSRHNRKYWHHVPYLGLGPSAHSHLDDRRWWNERDLLAWGGRVAAGERPVAGEETLERTELALERLMLGLRTRDGVSLGELEARFGIDVGSLNRDLLVDLEEQGLLRRDDDRLCPTLEGMAVADRIAASLRLA